MEHEERVAYDSTFPSYSPLPANGSTWKMWKFSTPVKRLKTWDEAKA
jgi:hypothetical protein